jgi:hypothetical protein
LFGSVDTLSYWIGSPAPGEVEVQLANIRR